MDHFIRNTVAIAAGIGIGLASSWLAVERGYGFGAVSAGPWTGWPKAGADDADPYARAVIARTGEMALGPAEGLSFLARRDSSGRLLDGRCAYILRSPVPPARYWALSLTGEDGQALPGDLRKGFTSAEITRIAPGPFTIALSRQVRPGNWLPLPQEGPFVLMLRLYDTPLSANAGAIGAGAMPSIERADCR